MDDSVLWSVQALATAAVNVGFATLIGCLASLWILYGAESPWVRERADSNARCLRLAVAWLVATTLILLWVQTAVMSDQPLLTAVGSIGMVLKRTHLGHAWAAGALGLAGLGISFLIAEQRIAARRATAGWWACAAIFAASKSWGGHAGSTGVALPVLVDWCHLLAVSVWSGAVFTAAAFVLRRPLPVSSIDRTDCASYVQTLSTTVTWALSAVVLSGAFSSWRNLGGAVGPLVSSLYGEILLGKLALVALAIAMGAYNRFVVMPRLLTALSTRSQSFEVSLRAFRRVVRLESLVLFLVLVAAAALSVSAPPSAHDPIHPRDAS